MSSTPSSPGGKVLEAMKDLKKLMVEFKTPLVPTKKTKMKILTEEHYIEELSKIIQRDFFPDLQKLNAQNEYLDAIEKNDVVKLREIYAKYSGKRPRGSDGSLSPATFETPAIASNSNTPRTNTTASAASTPAAKSTKSDSISSQKPKSMGDRLSLDQFLSNYTSEDNSSFQDIIEAAEEKLRQKFAVLYCEEHNSIEKLKNVLALPNIETQFDPIEGPKPIDTWTYKNKNYIMYIPDGVSLTEEEKVEMSNRKQEIAYSNTRLTSNPFNDAQKKETISALARTQANNLCGKIGVDGLLMQKNPPAFRGFDLLQTPSPCPGEGKSPLMTWGEIEGTPFRLDGGDTPVRATPGPSFRINQTSRREVIALELAEKAGERMRGQKQKAIDAARRNIASPHIRSSMERLASMSPAAKRLASLKLGLRTTLVTPSPLRTPVVRKTSKGGVRKHTPSPLVRKKPPARTATDELKQPNDSPALTDDLLKIPSHRTKAADFF